MDSPDDIKMGLHIIVILCLIVIAMSQYNMAYGSSYLTNAQAIASGGSNLRFQERSQFIGSANSEPPVFYNMGSVDDTNKALQAAAAQSEGYANSPSYQVASSELAGGVY